MNTKEKAIAEKLLENIEAALSDKGTSQSVQEAISKYSNFVAACVNRASSEQKIPSSLLVSESDALSFIKGRGLDAIKAVKGQQIKIGGFPFILGHDTALGGNAANWDLISESEKPV